MWEFNNKEKIALYQDDGKTLSYGQLDKEVESLFKHINRRCLCFILTTNTIGSIISYVTCLKKRVVPALISRNLDVTMLDTLIQNYRPAFIMVPLNMEDDILKLDVFRDGKLESIYEFSDYVLFSSGFVEDAKLYDDLALLLTTSGSTGSPKFVRQSYINIESNTKSIIEYLKIDDKERAITTLPMNYTYGLSIINTHLQAGASLLLTDKTLMQKGFWDFFKQEKATSFGGVPYTYEMLDKLKVYKMDIDSLKTMTQAGGKLTPELHEKFAKFAQNTGRNFVVMYGQCEATARMAYLPANQAVLKKGSMGIAIPGGSFKLIDEKGQQITTSHTTGELVYEGANVTLGYATTLSDLSKGDERNGILYTGDMAQFDEDGYYYIVGRKKRFLKIYGNRVNLDEVDRLIKGKFEIEVACAGVDDCMYIFLTDKAIASEVAKFVSEKTRLNPAAFKTVVIDEIPKNDAGKTTYKELEKYYDV